MPEVLEKESVEKVKGTTQSARRSGHKSRRRTSSAPQKNMHNKELGKRGEDAAVRFLENRGFSILERNWSCFAGEADIIALDDQAIHFVEVKTRIGEGSGFPSDAVNAKKRRRYEAIAELYLSSYEGCETGVTFDVISINVLENQRAYMRFYTNVLSCDCGRS